MKKRIFVTLAVCGMLSGCSVDKSESFTTLISGYHKVSSVTSDVAVDMNNDGVKSIDLYAEITAPFGGTGLSYFDFDSPQNFMEVRPLPYQTNEARLISLNIPDQHIFESNGGYVLGEYLRTFLAYRYELDASSRNVKLIKTNPEFVENGTFDDFQLMDDGMLKLQMTKKVFDFASSQWVQARLTIVYSKVE